jgi:hypothetical protein
MLFRVTVPVAPVDLTVETDVDPIRSSVTAAEVVNATVSTSTSEGA